MVESTLVCIASYERPKELARLLDSLSPTSPRAQKMRVVVVDNDPECSARVAVEPRPWVEYISEPTPGIVAARNAALAVRSDETYIAFVDDDEWVCEDWLERLLAARVRHGADVVHGPVIPIYPANAPEWVIEGQYFERRRYVTGEKLRHVASNNTLVCARALESLEVPWFDEVFSEMGGEDTEFFGRLLGAGATAVWCDEAVVFEEVPASRMNWAWVRRRQVRIGNVNGVLLARAGRAPTACGLGLVRTGVGVLLWLSGLAVYKRSKHAGFRHFWRGIGTVKGALGGRTLEYRRVDG